MADKFVTMGRVSGVFGVKGWIKVKPFTESLESLCAYTQWFLKNDQQWRAMNIEVSRIHGAGLVAKLEGIDDRDQAALLVRNDIAIERNDLPTLSPQEFYWHQLTGLNVVNVTGHVFGQIKEMIETGANDVMVVQSLNVEAQSTRTEVLIPYIWDKVVKQVDLETMEVLVDWHESWV